VAVHSEQIHCVPKKWPHFCSLNNSVKDKPVWITFGMQNPEEILHSCFRTCPPRPKKTSTVPCEHTHTYTHLIIIVKCRKYHFQQQYQLDMLLRAWNCIYFFHKWKLSTAFTCEHTKLSNVCCGGNQNAWHLHWPAPMHASHTSFSDFIMGGIPAQHRGQSDWLVIEITWNIYQHKR